MVNSRPWTLMRRWCYDPRRTPCANPKQAKSAAPFRGNPKSLTFMIFIKQPSVTLEIGGVVVAGSRNAAKIVNTTANLRSRRIARLQRRARIETDHQ